MTTLSQLAHNRRELLDLISKISTFEFDEVIDRKVNSLNQLDLLSDYREAIDNTVSCYKELISSNNKIILNLQQLVNSISDDMDIKEQEIDQQFGHKFRFESEFVTTNTYSTRIPPTVKETIKVRIRSFSSHVYPGFILGCKFKEWVDCLLASDPLYITNFNLASIDEIIAEYTPEYQRRLRLYEVKGCNYQALPQEQFGIIVSWDYFPYLSQDNLTLCLTAAYNLLRPGGMFIFNYNNHYLRSTAKHIEQGAISGHTYSQIIETCANLGFQILRDNQIESDDLNFDDVSWFELQKPGKLSTTKLKQVLGQILTK